MTCHHSHKYGYESGTQMTEAQHYILFMFCAYAAKQPVKTTPSDFPIDKIAFLRVGKKTLAL